MAGLKWIVSAGLLLSGVLAAPSPQAPASSSAAPAPAASSEPEVVDLAAQFVSELITNATQAEEEQLAASKKRSLTCKAKSSLVVDLGYAKYQGYADPATGLNNWKGSESLSEHISYRVCC